MVNNTRRYTGNTKYIGWSMADIVCDLCNECGVLVDEVMNCIKGQPRPVINCRCRCMVELYCAGYTRQQVAEFLGIGSSHLNGNLRKALRRHAEKSECRPKTGAMRVCRCCGKSKNVKRAYDSQGQRICNDCHEKHDRNHKVAVKRSW